MSNWAIEQPNLSMLLQQRAPCALKQHGQPRVPYIKYKWWLLGQYHQRSSSEGLKMDLLWIFRQGSWVSVRVRSILWLLNEWRIHRDSIQFYCRLNPWCFNTTPSMHGQRVCRNFLGHLHMYNDTISWNAECHFTLHKSISTKLTQHQRFRHRTRLHWACSLQPSTNFRIKQKPHSIHYCFLLRESKGHYGKPFATLESMDGPTNKFEVPELMSKRTTRLGVREMSSSYWKLARVICRHVVWFLTKRTQLGLKGPDLWILWLYTPKDNWQWKIFVKFFILLCLSYWPDGLNHGQPHVDTINGMLWSGNWQSRDTVVAISENLNPEAVVFLEAITIHDLMLIHWFSTPKAVTHPSKKFQPDSFWVWWPAIKHRAI